MINWENKTAVDYKGKHFIVVDKDSLDDMDYELPYIDLSKVNLKQYASDCDYYGVPRYYGKDEELLELLKEDL